MTNTREDVVANGQHLRDRRTLLRKFLIRVVSFDGMKLAYALVADRSIRFRVFASQSRVFLRASRVDRSRDVVARR